MTTVTKWLKQHDCPPEFCGFSVAINCDEFIIASNETEGICKWNMRTNECKLIWKYSQSDLHCDDFEIVSLAFNAANNSIYLCVISMDNKSYDTDIVPYIITVNLSTYKYNARILDNIEPESIINSSGIVINNEYNIVGGVENTHHFVEDEIIHTFNDWEDGNVFSSLIHAYKRNCLYLIAGMEFPDGIPTCSDAIYKFDITQKKWGILPVKLPTPRAGSGSVLTLNEKHVIMFGCSHWVEPKGVTENWSLLDSDSIVVFDLDTMELKQSKLKCPIINSFEALIVWDNKQDILIHGYIRKLSKIWNSEKLCILPNDLMAIIIEFYFVEFVHLFEPQDESNGHWMINVDHVFDFQD